MLSTHQISKNYGINTVLQNITFSINNGDRIGLIGPNGCGKSTLMHILNGLETADAGTVAHPHPDLKIGYLSQGFELDPRLTIAQVCARDIPTDPDTALAELAASLAANPSDHELQTRFDNLITLFSTVRQPEEILFPLGLAEIDTNRLVGTLSGGQKTRLMLARLMAQEPNLLLLDEPTNHLDIAMLEWLEDWLDQFRGAALIASHDRVFLDNTVNRILDLNQDTHTIQEYTGNYSRYLEQYLAEHEKLSDDYREQVAEIRCMRKDNNRTKQQALNVERSTTSRQPGVRRYANKVAHKALSRQKKLYRYLDSEERVEKPIPGWQIKIDFSVPAHQSREVLVTENLAIGYSGIPPLMEMINLNLRGGERVALTGPNGCGKTTLLRTLAGTLEPLAGSVRL